jgi:osmotically-inducible protein OsmY
MFHEIRHSLSLSSTCFPTEGAIVMQQRNRWSQQGGIGEQYREGQNYGGMERGYANRDPLDENGPDRGYPQRSTGGGVYPQQQGSRYSAEQDSTYEPGMHQAMGEARDYGSGNPQSPWRREERFTSAQDYGYQGGGNQGQSYRQQQQQWREGQFSQGMGYQRPQQQQQRGSYGQGSYGQGNTGWERGQSGYDSEQQGQFGHQQQYQQRGYGWEQERSGQGNYFGMGQGSYGQGEGNRQSRRSGREARRNGWSPKNYTRSDERIREEINDEFMANNEFDPSEVEVTVNQGEVTLTGTVESRHEKWCAEDLAEDVLGVKEVINQLRIKQRSRGQRNDDDDDSSSNDGSRSGQQRQNQNQSRSNVELKSGAGRTTGSSGSSTSESSSSQQRAGAGSR